jgi:TonB family protein
VAIYTIPAVDLFSEGFEGPLSDMIVVDLVQEEISEGQPPIPQPPDNQFLASQPEQEPDMPSEEDTSQPSDDLLSDPDDEISIPLPAEKDLEMETQYTLLANSGARDPEIEQLRKRPVKREKPILPKNPELPKPDKLPAEQKEFRPIEMNRPIPLQPRRPSIAPTRVENSQKKNKPEEDLNFPLEAHRPEERQFSTEELPEKMFGFDKRPAKEMNRENMPVSSPSFGGASPPVKRIGLNKGNEDDKNRFGIFAGDNFEMPDMKEIVQEASAAEKKKETTLSEEAETAQNLKINDQIEGPVKGRTIVYQPSPPQVDLVNEIEFKLKFWVLPDGTIGEVIPLKRGDAKLERVAIAYLKKWQFEPLSPEVPQRKIWGTIPIRFTVQ